MTVQEAIECIDNVLSSDYNYDETLEYQLTSDDIDWLNIAKEALEKQIPKKPDEVFDEYDYFVCPCCKESIYSSTGDVTDHKFCLECGQALDWSDEENDL